MPPLPDRSNRLVQETSPYLLQHANNPVAWWPWGDAALAEARRLNKPILLSVGYAACHWCHVMAHESFEDDATAAVMNDLFVSIKVDREERPDIDQIYMNALHLLGEQGGWPLTMFLTPRGEPFWGGTYFPKVSRFGRPAFVDVLREVARVFREEPDKIERNRDGLMAQLGARGRAETPGSLGLAELDRAAASIVQATDPVNGGLRGAPKFPQCQMLEFLWRAGTRTADPRFSHTTNLALTHMSQGGIYDHLAGGFARYSVDDKWLVPHFEKMLYDNAQILDVLTLEHARAPNPLYAARAHETVGWLLSEMVTDEGAFASSLDADSDGEEGKFYVWTLSEIRDALGADAEEFIRAYGVTETGNFEGLTILNRLNDIAFDAEADARLSRLRRILLSTRAQRTRPGRDDKVLADWNGLMIAALANASAIFDTPGWLDAARRAFAMIQTTMMRNGRLGHSWRAGRLVLPGFASDYAAMIRASLALFEVTQEHTYLTQAMSWQSEYERHHADAEGATYFLTADDTTDLIVRPHATLDDAIPNHNGLAAQNLIRLAALTGDDAFLLRADRLFDALLPIAAQNAFGHLSVLNALDLRLRGAQIVICGEGDKAQRLFSTAIKSPPAIRMVLAARNADALPPSSPALEKARMVTCPAAFICRGETCTLPIEDQDALRESLAR